MSGSCAEQTPWQFNCGEQTFPLGSSEEEALHEAAEELHPGRAAACESSAEAGMCEDAGVPAGRLGGQRTPAMYRCVQLCCPSCVPGEVHTPPPALSAAAGAPAAPPEAPAAAPGSDVGTMVSLQAVIL